MKQITLLWCLSLILLQNGDNDEKLFMAELYEDGEIHLMAPGVISTVSGEYSPTFDSERNELYFMRRTPGKFDYTIYSSKLDGKVWSEPEVVSFSGHFRDAGPYLSPDGNTLFFDSRRSSSALQEGSINLWYSKRIQGVWSAAKLLSVPSKNTNDESTVGQDEFGPAVDGAGNLYFYSFRHPYREGARYISFPDDYDEAKLETRLPDPSASTFISYLSISVDGDMAIMEGRAKFSNDTDLYCSCRQANGDWTSPQPISFVNTKASEGGPYLTSDSKYLLFVSNRPTGQESAQNANIFIVAAKKILASCIK